MAFAEKLIAVRRAHHLTQEQLAAKLFVTRQAISRWERGEVTPGIDMMKLIAAVTGEPLSHLLEMPEHYCQSCGMILTPDDCGTMPRAHDRPLLQVVLRPRQVHLRHHHGGDDRGLCPAPGAKHRHVA